MKLRAAGPQDAIAIAALMARSFDPVTLGLTIYGCRGIARYLAVRMRLPVELSDYRELLALDAGRTAGFAELRSMTDAVCLNYVAIAPGWRGRRYGDRLLMYALDSVAAAGPASVVLDVFASNPVSGQWYRKLGFESEHDTVWWSLPTALEHGEGAAARCLPEGLPEADACERAYGFSRFALLSPRRTYRIGRLGHCWFRTQDPALLEDADALACLARIDPARKILGLFASDFTPDKRHRALRLDTSTRMRTGMFALRARLAERIGD